MDEPAGREVQQPLRADADGVHPLYRVRQWARRRAVSVPLVWPLPLYDARRTGQAILAVRQVTRKPHKQQIKIVMLNNILRSLGLAPQPPRLVSLSMNRAIHPKPTSRPRTGTDLVGVIGFNNSAFYISLPVEPWGDKLATRVATLPTRLSGGGTNIAAALRLALEMSRKCPRGARRRIWLLSDGEHNCDVHDTLPAAQAIADWHLNLNVIAFGEAAGSALLQSLAAKTHHGQFVSVSNLHEMAAALKRGGQQAKTRKEHRQEVAILCVDCSPSMNTRDFGGQTRIEAVRDAIQSLLTYKASVWS